MIKPNSDHKTESELRENLQMANEIVSFYEEVMASLAKQIEAQKLENKGLKHLVSESQALLKTCLGSSLKSIIN